MVRIFFSHGLSRHFLLRQARQGKTIAVEGDPQEIPYTQS